MTKKGEIYIKIIAERLKEARNENARTQSDLAEVLNISLAAFGEYERTREDVILVEGKHEEIIEPELFEAVGKTFRETPPADTKKLRNMFA